MTTAEVRRVLVHLGKPACDGSVSKFFRGDRVLQDRIGNIDRLLDEREQALVARLDLADEPHGARPIIERLKQHMRARGVRGIPRGPRPATREHPFQLTNREMEVLACLVDGLSNVAIAAKLSLSPRTVEHHIASIRHKMGVDSRNEAVARALKDKLIPME